MLERLRYFILRALRNMRQSPFLSTATVLTVTVSLAIVAVFALLVINVERMAGVFSREVQVVAYLDPPPGEVVLEEWRQRIAGFSEVERVRYVSRKQAYERFKGRLGSDADLLEGVSPEILPASLEIALKEKYRNRAGVAAVVERLQRELGLSDLQFGQDWLEKFESVMVLLRVTGLVLGGILILAALLIVSNTIRLTLYARKDELEIMTLVGGTPLFIKTPFLLEGLFQGGLGGGLALGGVHLFFLTFLRRGLGALLLTPGDFEIVFLPPSLQLAIIGGGMFLGLCGSLVSLRKLIRI